MTQWLALVRGINVGGNNIVSMKVLAQCMADAGCVNVKTYIQSGNLVFQHSEVEPTSIVKLLSELINQNFGFLPKVMVVSAAEFRQILIANPYKQIFNEPKEVHFFFCKHPPISADLVALQQLTAPTEVFELFNSGLYLFAPQGIGRSKLVANMDKLLGQSTTARNLNTLLKLDKLLKD